MFVGLAASRAAGLEKDEKKSSQTRRRTVRRHQSRFFDRGLERFAENHRMHQVRREENLDEDGALPPMDEAYPSTTFAPVREEEIQALMEGDDAAHVEDDDSNKKKILAEMRDKLFFAFDGIPPQVIAPSPWPRVSIALIATTMTMVFLSSIVLIVETLPQKTNETAIFTIETVSVIWFIIDYAVRISMARQRWSFFRKPLNLIDLITILPYFVDLISSSVFSSFAVFKVLRLVRILKVSKHSGGIHDMTKALGRSTSALTLLSFLMFISMLIFSSLMFFAESLSGQNFHPEDRIWIRHDGTVSPYQSILHSLWWCIVTLTTVGYGDVFPVTSAGKVAGGLTMMAGVLVIAFPTVILSAAFHETFMNRTTKTTLDKIRRRQIESVVIARKEFLESKSDDRGAQLAAKGDKTMRESGAVKDFSLRYVSFAQRRVRRGSVPSPMMGAAQQSSADYTPPAPGPRKSKFGVLTTGTLSKSTPDESQSQSPIQGQNFMLRSHSKDGIDSEKGGTDSEKEESNGPLVPPGAGLPSVGYVPPQVFDAQHVEETYDGDSREASMSTSSAQLLGRSAGTMHPDQNMAEIRDAKTNLNRLMMQELMVHNEGELIYPPKLHILQIGGTNVIKANVKRGFGGSSFISMYLVVDDEVHNRQMKELARGQFQGEHIRSARVARIQKLKVKMDFQLDDDNESPLLSPAMSFRSAASAFRPVDQETTHTPITPPHLTSEQIQMLQQISLVTDSFGPVMTSQIPLCIACPTPAAFALFQRVCHCITFSFAITFQVARHEVLTAETLNPPATLRIKGSGGQRRSSFVPLGVAAAEEAAAPPAIDRHVSFKGIMRRRSSAASATVASESSPPAVTRSAEQDTPPSTDNSNNVSMVKVEPLPDNDNDVEHGTNMGFLSTEQSFGRNANSSASEANGPYARSVTVAYS